MPRPLRTAPGGFVYHVLNRANGKRRIFAHDGDYRAFESLLAEAQERVPMRILAWCVMPNHWHLLLWPRNDGDLSSYVGLVSLIHAQRWHAYRATAGTGHLYQGRFKSFLVQHDAHFLTVCRYVEANALRAGLVKRAEDWRWGSVWRAQHGQMGQPPRLDDWPLARPKDWFEYVNAPAKRTELEALRRCARRGSPYGNADWVFDVAVQLGLESTLRPRGRPRRSEEKVPDTFLEP